MWSSIVLVLLLGETADAPQQPCDWWWREADASGAVPRVTPGSGVLLPLSMSPFRPSPYEDDPRLDPADLRVVVRDATWQEHEGRIRFEDPFSDVHADGFPHERDLWWEPLAPLAPGTYTLDLTVGPPPRRGVCAQRGYDTSATAFEARVSFAVSAELPTPPKVTIEARLESVSLTGILLSTSRGCPRGQVCVSCDLRPGINCFAPAGVSDWRALKGRVTLSELDLAPPGYYRVNLRAPGLFLTSGFPWSRWETPQGDVDIWFSEPLRVEAPLLEAELYAFVTRGRVAFASTEVPVLNPAEPWPQCPAEACAACAASEKDCGPIASQADVPDPDPPRDFGGGGCNGAQAPGWALGLFSAWCASRVARRRSARARAATRASRA